MKQPKVIREFGYLRRGQNDDTLAEVWLPDRSFDLMYDFVTEQGDHNTEVSRAFRYGKRQGREYIQVLNHVGVIQLRDGTHIEVLPKLLTQRADMEPAAAIAESRRTFLRMLNCLRNSPFIDLDQAQLKADRFPLLEVFIAAYLAELDQLLRRGLQRAYHSQTANQTFLKGRLEVAQHLQHNLLHPERFYVTFDTYELNTPWHRLIKRTLLKLQPLCRALPNQRALQRHLFVWDEVPPSQHLHRDWQALDFTDRQHQPYHQLMRWSRVFLFDQSFTNFQGNQLNLALLFPMERIFEDYVGHWLRQQYHPTDLRLQDRRHHLIENFEGRRTFGLRPDFVFHLDQRLIIADAKWKRLDPSNQRAPLGISQADLYQLYAYGHKYTQNGQPPQLWLLYPEQPVLAQGDLTLHYDQARSLIIKGVPLGPQPNQVPL